ncbi:MAG: DMT family transporter [Hyphomicrobiales bacterium]|nr:DMT family transporter [Hyphomicrobiales bacterium]MBV9740641.1 DMT family transporter [Hyphomicrobiales bacterium]
MAPIIGPILAGVGLVAGATLGTQAAINAMVSRAFGSPIIAAAISFGTGALLLLVMALAVARLQGTAEGWRSLPPWAFLSGGALGVIYLTTVIFLTPRIGAAATMGFVVAGQLLAGLAIDNFGLFGLSSIPLASGRLLGAALLLSGALILRFS